MPRALACVSLAGSLFLLALTAQLSLAQNVAEPTRLALVQSSEVDTSMVVTEVVRRDFKAEDARVP